MAESPTPAPAIPPACQRTNADWSLPAQLSPYVEGVETHRKCACGGVLPSHKLLYCSGTCRNRAVKRRGDARRTPEQRAEKKRRYTLRVIADPVRLESRRRANRDRDLKLNYGLTLEQYEGMAASQGGLCGICGEAPPRTGPARLWPLVVDHCHATGRVRGLLCARCNIGIGYFRDRPELLTAATGYLERT
jgi:hypothetical protein